MRKVSLLPADTYIVINKTVLTELERKNIINLYEPIIGPLSASLYLTLWSDLDKRELMSKDFTHHHLMTLLKSSLDEIKEARKGLEAVGLLKTFYKNGDDINNYVYELFSPLSAYEFFNHPILNIILYNNIGISEYDNLINIYKKPSFNYSNYEDVTFTMDKTFKSIPETGYNTIDIQRKETSKININELIDFDLLISSVPNQVLNEKALSKKTKELINNLAFVYNLDTLKMSDLIRLTIDEKGLINKDLLLKETRKYYEYSSSGSLPTLIYRTQPEHLKTPEGNVSNRGKMIYIFENTTPYDFLKNKYKNVNPTSRDLKLLEYLAVELSLPPGVINVLIDYVLRINNNKLTMGFIETIAGQWVRLGIKTAEEAMAIAEKEHKKTNKNIKRKTDKPLPVWFNKTNNVDEISSEEKTEMENLLKEFR
ncbi:MAG: DnaD domain protein [Bacilli bacterium]|nr:DnaD domain protein [Bacilli bacterium]MDD4795181.1 DnaD domain protein [Bacilli bacterium]